ncbi:MAG TPA: putative baseplate assembly protein [Mycobacterium sp.]|nr:putative baseplate assembly protein [Mycobacterium sp.]
MTSDDRRTAVRNAKTVNGIDFVEVDPTSDTTLIVHFLLNLPTAAQDPVPPDPADALVADNFVISGGERITSINVVSATTIAADQMQVVVDRTGDFSVYCLSLHANTETHIPAGFDPASACASFIFHIDCAANFDCQPSQDCPPEVVTPPPINYLAKDYPSMVQVMLGRLSLLAPTWTERNPADVGVALVEMMAYVGDQLSYRQDVIATEAYLGTARLRTSARRHARLVDYFIGEGSNARAWIRVLLAPSWPDGNTLPAHTRCCTWYPGATPPALPDESAAYQQAVNAGAVFFETMAETSPLFQQLHAMPLYAWSDSQACLAPGATHATLNGAFDKLAPGMVVVLAEVKGPRTGDPADADPQKRQAVTITTVLVTEDPVTGKPVTEIDWAPQDALTFPVCVSSITDPAHGEQQVWKVSAAWGNIVLADHGRSVGGFGGSSDPLSTGPEPLGVVPSQGRFRPGLANPNLTFAAAPPGSAQPAAAANPTGTPMPVVTLTSTDPDHTATTWTPAPGQNLFDETIDSETAAFIAEVENDGTAYILFGDGVNGMVPVAGDSFTTQYRVGNGTSGNVGRDTITLIDIPSGVTGIAGVTNPLPASGGVDPETVDHIRQSAPVAFQTQKRAVTEADYAALTMAYAGVQRADATLRWTGSWHTVFITVERDRQAALDTQFIDELEAYLDGYRMAGVDLEVQDGVQVPLLIQMKVCAAPDYVAADVEQALLAVFNATVQPDGSPGLFNPSRLNLGQPFYLSPLIAAAQSIDGVASVTVVTFERQDQPGTAGLAAGVLVPQPLEFFVLANDPNYPERGRFDLTVGGGL